MKKILLTFFSVFYSTLIFCQQPIITWDNPQETKDQFLHLFSNKNNEIVKLSRVKTGKKDCSYAFQLTKYDSSFKILDSKKSEESTECKSSYIINGKNKNFILSDAANIDRTKCSFSIQKIDVDNLTITQPIEIASFTSGMINLTKTDDYFGGATMESVKNNYHYYRVCTSNDTSKYLLLLSNSNSEEKQNFKCIINTYNQDFTQLLNKEIELPISVERVELFDYFVSNNGVIGIVYLEYFDDEKLKNLRSDLLKKGETTDIPCYDIKTFLVNADGKEIKHFTIPLENKFTHNIDVKFDKDNNIEVNGLYQEHSGSIVTGFFNIKLDKQGTLIKKQFTPYSIDIVKQILSQRQIEKLKDNIGLPSSFIFFGVTKRDNGSIDYLVRENKSFITSEVRSGRRFDQLSSIFEQMPTGKKMDYITFSEYGDIININLTQKGDIKFSRIPLFHSFQTYETSRSNIQYLSYNNNLYLFYNDSRDNLTKTNIETPKKVFDFYKSTFIVATIDEKGDVSKKELYMNDRKKYITSTYHCKPIAVNKLTLWLNDRSENYEINNEQIGYLEIK